ncbi:MAG: hypothetical protein AB1798_03715 [Spirochaetota bacterium]
MSEQESARSGGPDDAGNSDREAKGSPGQRPGRERGHGFDMDTWWEDRSLTQKILWGIGFGILAIGLLAALGVVVMALWNWLMPDIFGLKRLGYWQAWGLLVLCWILFKGIRLGSDESSRRSDRKRRRQLRSYMREDQPPAQEDAAGFPKA